MKDRPWLNWALTATLAIAAAYIGARWGIVIPPLPPLPAPSEPAPPPTAPALKPDPLNAICKIGFNGSYCSGCVIGARRADGRYWVISAAHCVEKNGERCELLFRDGRSLGAQVVSFDRKADYAWLATDTTSEVLPFALLADSTPPVGTRIWHAGFGVHNPGNREDGEITALANSDGQIKMRLSVSSGDSGGGIAIDADGKIVSTVCCTSGRGRVADVWGTSVEAAKLGQRDVKVLGVWAPKEIPVRPEAP